MKTEFTKELEALLNKYGADTECGTPDYILAEYLTSCLETYRDTVRSRDNCDLISRKMLIEDFEKNPPDPEGVDEWIDIVNCQPRIL